VLRAAGLGRLTITDYGFCNWGPELVQYTVDGQPWMACWTDDPNNGWGTYDETWKIGLAVPDGEHELAVRDMVFPRVWTRPFTPLIKGR
jgi:hypothetical protein